MLALTQTGLSSKYLQLVSFLQVECTFWKDNCLSSSAAKCINLSLRESKKRKKKTSHVQIFFVFLCKWRELVKETFYVKKNRGHQASMRVKSSRSYRNGYSPYMWLESFLSARARCMTWRNVATGITCAVRMRITSLIEILKTSFSDTT